MRIFQCIISNNLGFRKVKTSFINLIEFRERRVTCQQLTGDIKHVKKYRIFSRVLLRLFSEPEILVQHRGLYDKLLSFVRKNP